MKKYILITLIVLCTSINFVNSQTSVGEDEAAKYWYYRQRLINEFLVVGNADNGDCDVLTGYSIPTKEIFSHSRKFTMEDATTTLGFYISVLATELRLLYDYGFPYESTQKELMYALKTYERLDKICENFCPDSECEPFSNGAGCSYNGLFVRDDVSENLFNNHKGFRKKYDYTGNNEFFSGSIVRWENGVNVSGDNDFPSQEQISGLLMGFALVKKCLEGIPEIESFNGYDFVDEAVQFTYLITNRYFVKGWLGTNENDDILRYGHNVLYEGNAFGFAKAAGYITGTQYSAYFPDKSLITALFNSFIYQHFSNVMYDAQNGLPISDPVLAAYNHQFLLDYSRLIWTKKQSLDGDPLEEYIAEKSISEPYNNGFEHITALVLRFAAIGNSWNTSNLVDYCEMFDMELYAILHYYLHDKTGLDISFWDNVDDMLLSAPFNGPHYKPNMSTQSRYYDDYKGLSTSSLGVEGWRSFNRFIKSKRAIDGKDISGNDKAVIGSGLDYMLLYNLTWLQNPKIGCQNKEYYYYPILNIYDDIETAGTINSYWPLYFDKKIKNTTETSSDGVKIYCESPIEMMAGFEIENGVNVEINVSGDMPIRQSGGLHNPPLSCALISGPSKGNNSGTYEWCASASNGYPPYSYYWEYRTGSNPNYSPWHSGQCKTEALPVDEHLILKVTITDSSNNQVETTRMIINEDAQP